MKNSKSVRMLGFTQDITDIRKAEEDRRLLEEDLARAKKMEALGLLAGGVAHDLNNILSGLVTYPELLLMQIPQDSKLRRPLEIIRASGERAAAVVSDLISITRSISLRRQIEDINHILQEYQASPEHIDIERRHPSVDFDIHIYHEPLYILCSSIHIKKVIMNLLTNAFEAISGSGNVIVATQHCVLEKPLKGYGEIPAGEYAVLSISDNGSGISPSDLECIFDPFYTKKIMGRSGTGLGLTVVWNTMQEHRGYINVASGAEGTSFHLYFPLCQELPDSCAEKIPIESYLGNNEKILVIDDEETQREVTCEMLENLGYTAYSVSCGQEAVEYLKHNPADLIVLDMILSGNMNGLETYREIIRRHPDQKALIVSGFAETDEVREAQKLGAGAYIRKPYTLEVLGMAIRKELRRNPESC
jgi:nitrogen-specific signal transduction histidine kinase/CheY-like chemotaxis protein